MTKSFALKTFISDRNARYYGIPAKELMENAGREVAEVVTKKFGKDRKIGVFCGLGNNGGDGFVVARYLARDNGVTVFLIGRPEKIKTDEARKNWEELSCKKVVNPRPGEIPNNFDIVIEALLGVGVKGKPRKPFVSAIRKLNVLSGKKVAIDVPAPGFKADLTVSLDFPKTKNAVVVGLGIPKEIKEKVGVVEVKALFKPSPDSHKGENGKLLIIGGSEQFHGAPFLTLKVASKIVDLVYFSSTPENNDLLKDLKSEVCEFIAVSRKEVEAKVEEVDCVLLGPGMGASDETKATSERLLKKFPKQKWVIDADPLRLIKASLLSSSTIVTPHAGEFKDLFSMSASKENVAAMAKKHQCVIVLKGPTDIICSPEECKISTTGNQGMTKGGTGDVLAGLIAALACKNSLFLAACAGTFINGLAGDRLKEKVSYYFNASDLIDEIPKVLKWAGDF